MVVIRHFIGHRIAGIRASHSVQITRRFVQEHEACGDVHKAAVVAIEHTMTPATLSIITDMVGFATLSLVDISFYKAYAYFGMFGMLTLLLTTTTLIPLLMVSFPPKQRQAVGERGWEVKVGEKIQALLVGPGKWVPIAVVVGIIAISAHYSGITQPTSDDLMPGVEKGINYSRAAFKESSITIEHIKQLSEIMPGVYTDARIFAFY